MQYARQNITASNTIDQLGRRRRAGSTCWSANLDQERRLGTLLYRYRQGLSRRQLCSPTVRKRHVGSYSLWDAQAEFAVAPNVRLLFGVQNLFDTNPPYSNVGDTLLGYDPRLC